MSRPDFPGVARLRRRRLIKRLIVIGALVLVLLASAVLWPRQQQGALAVPTVTAAAGTTGVVRGALVADRAGDRVCFRIRAQGGDAQLRLPAGWSADEQRALLDPAGAAVAQPGDTVLVTGEPGPVGAIDSCPGTGRVWAVASVTLAR